MVDQNDGSAAESRPPTLADLLRICGELNERGAKYIVIGGMAIIQAGFVRATEDIDLLIDASSGNQKKVRQALMILPDQAIRQVHSGDIDKYVVVKVADEVVIDLMKTACGVDYDHAAKSIDWVSIEGVKIPFANAELLWKLKQTKRKKDALDLEFLRERLRKPK